MGFLDELADDLALGSGLYRKRNSSLRSILGSSRNPSRSSFFGLGGGHRSSYYKRSPRRGFVQRALRQLRRLARRLVYYARRHPWKLVLFFLTPLLTGGALTAFLARFGLRLPPSVQGLLGMASRAASGDSMGFVGDAAARFADGFAPRPRSAPFSSYASSSSTRLGRSRDGGLQWERRPSPYSYRDRRAWPDSIMDMAKVFL